MAKKVEHVCPHCGTKFPRERTLQFHVQSRHSPKAKAARMVKLAAVGVVVLGIGALAYALATAPRPPPPGLNLDGEPKMGSETAPVLFVMLEDPDCPFCKRFHDTTFPALVQEYVDTGRVQMFYKENSGGNPWSLEGAYAQECAYRLGGDGAFWNFTRDFYRDQNSINAAPGSPREKVRPSALRYAEEEALDAAAYARCYDNSEPRDEVLADYADARALGARGTPSFVIRARQGGEVLFISGAQPIEVFRQNIAKALTQAGA